MRLLVCFDHSTEAYYIGKSLAQLPFALLAALCVALPFYCIADLRGDFLTTYAVMLILYWCARRFRLVCETACKLLLLFTQTWVIPFVLPLFLRLSLPACCAMQVCIGHLLLHFTGLA